MKSQNLLCSWSGGKDSCFALMQAIKEGYTPKILLNVMNEEGQISRSHGLPAFILHQQAAQLGLPIHLVNSSWQDYEQNFVASLKNLSQQYQLTHAVFGDIDLQAHRDWEEAVCKQASLQALLPLWKRERKELVHEMLQAGIATMIVSCNNSMGKAYIGKTLTDELVTALETMGIDPCGENGEFHTMVVDCPLYTSPLQVNMGGIVQHNDYWFATDYSLK